MNKSSIQKQSVNEFSYMNTDLNNSNKNTTENFKFSDEDIKIMQQLINKTKKEENDKVQHLTSSFKQVDFVNTIISSTNNFNTHYQNIKNEMKSIVL